jgi:hypothetical protein
MTCGSTTYVPTHHIETATPSRQGPGWSWQIPLSWLAKIASKIASKIALGLERRHERAVEEALKSSWAHLLMWHVYR